MIIIINCLAECLLILRSVRNWVSDRVRWGWGFEWDAVWLNTCDVWRLCIGSLLKWSHWMQYQIIKIEIFTNTFLSCRPFKTKVWNRIEKSVLPRAYFLWVSLSQGIWSTLHWICWRNGYATASSYPHEGQLDDEANNIILIAADEGEWNLRVTHLEYVYLSMGSVICQPI